MTTQQGAVRVSEEEIAWMGRPLTDLSRDELLEAAEHMARELHRLFTPEAIRIRSLGRVEWMRRGGMF